MAMAGLQSVSLIHEEIAKVPGDDGIMVDGKYVIRQIEEVGDSISSVYQVYKLDKKEGTVNLLDPGTKKLAASRNQLAKVMGEFSDLLWRLREYIIELCGKSDTVCPCITMRVIIHEIACKPDHAHSCPNWRFDTALTCLKSP
jgi:hypothetical protein